MNGFVLALLSYLVLITEALTSGEYSPSIFFSRVLSGVRDIADEFKERIHSDSVPPKPFFTANS